jgi:dihydrofolate reductase
MPLEFSAIAAMAENRVIGSGNKIPWHLPEDFKWFKETTLGHVLVMGRKTFESIGRPLPGRETLVLSRTGTSFPGTRSVTSLDEVAAMDFGGRKVFIAGGAEIYSLALPLCAEVWLTVVHRTVEGDVHMPHFESEFAPPQKVRETPDFTIYHYLRP